MIWSTSVLTTVSSDTEPTIVVQFESAKYIFNAGENTSRSWLQSRHRWKKARGLFLTSVGTQRGSGVPGLMMFLADAGIRGLDIVGPPGMLHFLASMRSYLFRTSMGVRVTEVDSAAAVTGSTDPTPVYQDENIKLFAIPLLPNFSSISSQGLPSDLFMEDVEPQSANLKRKRSPSPSSSSKRIDKEKSNRKRIGESLPENNHSPSPIPSFPPSPFREQSGVPGFSPFSLHGSDAQQWRRLTIENLFPIPMPTEPKPSKGKSGKHKKVEKKTAESVPVPEPVPGTSKLRDPTPSPLITPRSIRHAHVSAFRDKRLPTFNNIAGELASKQSICYIVEGPRVRGKFDLTKAVALGLKAGPLRSQITRGETVTFMVDDGKGGEVERTVQPEDCIGPSEPPHVIMIFDVPSPDHIPSLVSAFAETAFYSRLCSKREEDRKDYLVHAIFHLCGNDVLEDNRYKEFMNKFSDAVHHVVASRKYATDPVTFTSAAFNQLRLNQLDSEMFPVHTFNLKPEIELSSVPGLPSNVSPLRSNMLVGVRPLQPPIHDQIAEEYDKFHPVVTSPTPVSLPPATLAAFSDARARIKADQESHPEPQKPGDDVVILPLGTSSALPSKYRNVSSTLVQLPDWGNILLDCGEGTWGQLARFFGDDPTRSSGVWQVLRDLKCIFVSHSHGDHHIGLAKVLAMRKQLNPPPTEPLYVVGLRFHILYLYELSDLEDLGLDSENGVVPILSDALVSHDIKPYSTRAHEDNEPWMDITRSRNLRSDLCKALGIHRFTAVDVKHKTRCYGLSMQHSAGWKIVFSADTMPAKNLVTAGRNATLLIHEATMADDQEEMAGQKAHSTCGQAIDIGRKMNAENILLTHFSARYPKMPPSLTEPESPIGKQTVIGLAFDHARVRIGDMRKLRAYLPAIEQSFADTIEEGDEDEDPSRESW